MVVDFGTGLLVGAEGTSRYGVAVSTEVFETGVFHECSISTRQRQKPVPLNSGDTCAKTGATSW